MLYLNYQFLWIYFYIYTFSHVFQGCFIGSLRQLRYCPSASELITLMEMDKIDW